MEKLKIKSCPHCGSKAKLMANYSPKVNGYFIYVRCAVCEAQSKAFFTTYNPQETGWNDNASYDALDAWNMRKKED